METLGKLTLLFIVATVVLGGCVVYMMYQKPIMDFITLSIIPMIQKNPLIAVTGLSAALSVVSFLVMIFRKLSQKVQSLSASQQQEQIQSFNLSEQLKTKISEGESLLNQVDTLTKERSRLQNTVELLSSQSTDLNSKIAEMTLRIKELEELKL